MRFLSFIFLFIRFLFFLPVWPLCLIGYYRNKEYVDADLKGISVPMGGGKFDIDFTAKQSVSEYLLFQNRRFGKRNKGLYA